MTTVTGACCLHSSAVTDLSFSEELYNHVNVGTEVPVLVQGAARAHTQCPDHSHTHNTCWVIYRIMLYAHMHTHIRTHTWQRSWPGCRLPPVALWTSRAAWTPEPDKQQAARLPELQAQRIQTHTQRYMCTMLSPHHKTRMINSCTSCIYIGFGDRINCGCR